MTVASNGILVNKTSQENKSTFSWEVGYPITTYLVSVTAYEYAKYEDWYVSAQGDSMAIEFYVAPDHLQNSKANFMKVNDMIGIYADLFGEYPFMEEKYGHVEFPWGGGMEHQTITSLGPISFSGGFYSFDLITHELAHMWWGDMITCESFHDIWLNEGFATYSESLIREVVDGPQGYKAHVSSLEYYGGGTIYVSDISNHNRIFDGNLSYSKAAYVLHMLRHVMGEDNFFNALKTYGSDPALKYKTASTSDFRRICESVSGMDLKKFFDQWIFGEYYPYYAYGFSTEPMGDQYKIILEIDQVQENTGIFNMPIDIRITTASGVENFVVRDSLGSQSFELIVDNEPLFLELDSDNWILKKTREKLLNPALDKGALLVNGLSWSLGEDIYSSYQNKSFWGNISINFWDLFDEPFSGYPESLPLKIGSGQLPASILAKYSTIIWLSHNKDGDLNFWKELPILDYLNEGGNIILITRMGREFLSKAMTDYLGIRFDD